MDAGTKSLESFIATKTTHYFGATSRGTARDSSTGFLLEKNKAALFALKACTVKEQARQLGVSYGVLRKWRTERKFKHLIEQHKNEFSAWCSGPRRDRTNTDYAIDQFRDFIESNADQKQRGNRDVFPSGIVKQLSKAQLNNYQRREYQMLCLDYALRISNNRTTARKDRQELVTLLEGLKETMN